MFKKASILAVAGAGVAVAQTATSSAATSSATIVGGTYSGQAIAGSHVGAAQSYQVALSKVSSGATASEIYFNSTSNLFMDNSIYSGEGLPCYVIKDSSIASGTGGPLECGAATSTNYPMTGQLGDDGTVYITGVQSWWVCDVNATQPYGIINGTVVGGFTTSEPAGSGVQNCQSITGLKLASGSSSSSSSTSSASSASKTSTSAGASTSASASTATSSGWGSGWAVWGSSSASASATSTASESSSASVSTSTATGWGSSSTSASANSVLSVTSTATGWGSTSTSASSSMTSTTSSWVASYTGGAVANGVSALGLMVAAGGVALMI